MPKLLLLKLKLFVNATLFNLKKRRGEMLYAWNVGLTKNIAIPTKNLLLLKQQSYMLEEQGAINRKKGP